MSIVWPKGNFAFTVFDDTDLSTRDNTKPIYDFLLENGFRTTKSCWVREPKPGQTGFCAGLTTNDGNYLKWLKELQESGFEIALHNVSWASSIRQETVEGLERFKELFGHYPIALANHARNAESIYWGGARLTGLNSLFYEMIARWRKYPRFSGHIERSPYFWGDICRDRIKYVRNFVYTDINTLKACPYMPYHDVHKPYVRFWFASTDGHDCRTFCKRISEANQDRLEAEGGLCIMYTHFAKDFYRNQKLNPEFKRLMIRLSRKKGWFVPVSAALDYLLEQRGGKTITRMQRKMLEVKWLCLKIFQGTV